MSVDFSQVKGIAIPDGHIEPGHVETLRIGKTIVWQATRGNKEVRANSGYAYIYVNSTGNNGEFKDGSTTVALGNKITAADYYVLDINNSAITFTMEKTDNSQINNYTCGNFEWFNTTGTADFPASDNPEWLPFEYAASGNERWDAELDLTLCRDNKNVNIPLYIIRSGTIMADSAYRYCAIFARFDEILNRITITIASGYKGNSSLATGPVGIRFRGVDSLNLFGVPGLRAENGSWTTIDNSTRSIGSGSSYSYGSINRFATVPAGATGLKLTLDYSQTPNAYSFYDIDVNSLTESTVNKSLSTKPITLSILLADTDYNTNLLAIRYRQSGNNWAYWYLRKGSDNKLSLTRQNNSSVTPSSNIGLYPLSITKIEAYVPA